ncbi:MAG: hypothetical protein GY832_09190 [Chloroflexi bacterium]|nr:hypothetical protein [Chloroflexota bacterium]
MDTERTYWTKASEKVPWMVTGFRSLSASGQALYYLLSHGSGNGKSWANLTLGIYKGYIESLAAELGMPLDECRQAMDALEGQGLAEYDPDHGFTLIPDQICAADNLSHLKGIFNRVEKKLPHSSVRAQYLEHLCSRTEAVSVHWTAEREEAEELLRQIRHHYSLLDYSNPQPLVPEAERPSQAVEEDDDLPF